MQMAAALSYYFVLSLFPALIFLSAVVAYLPVPDLFNQALALMAQFLPADSMGLVRRVVADVISPNKGTFLSFGILGSLWAASGGFAAAIEALNIAYEVKEDRPFWKTRPLALGLAFMTGALLLVALSVMIVGPRFGEWLAARVHLSGLFVLLWPYIHWTIAVGFTILAVEALYFLAPNVKQRFLATLPGAVLAVGCWIGLSYLLGIYFRHDGLVVLDRFCHAGGSGTQCGTGQDKQRRQAATKARTSCNYKNRSRRLKIRDENQVMLPSGMTSVVLGQVEGNNPFFKTASWPASQSAPVRAPTPTVVLPKLALDSGQVLTVINADPETPITDEDYPLGKIIRL